MQALHLAKGARDPLPVTAAQLQNVRRLPEQDFVRGHNQLYAPCRSASHGRAQGEDMVEILRGFGFIQQQARSRRSL